MPEYSIHIYDRSYSSWYFTDTHTREHISQHDERVSAISPVEHKLISGDVVHYVENTVTIQHSPIRSSKYIAGILVLDNNRTFGRTPNKKRLLYKCIPHNTQCPIFLVPYEISLGFSKRCTNKYVLFTFDSWIQTYPTGLLTEVVGDVCQPNMYDNYQLYCRNLQLSIAPFTKKTREALGNTSSAEWIRQISLNPIYNIHPMGGMNMPESDSRWILSIDPEHSTDLDDAFCISRNTDTGNWVVTVFIANVFIWLDALHLWRECTSRVSTIYLPTRKLPMLPPVLSDTICSLLENQTRFALSMKLEITPEGVVLYDTVQFQNVSIQVSKNYHYESMDLLNDTKYRDLLHITRRIDPTVTDSHSVVSFWMIQMNSICGKKLASFRSGLFRASVSTSTPNSNTLAQPEHLDADTRQFLSHWQNTHFMYCQYNECDLFHSGMNTREYIHITSPIRRIVDIVNQTYFLYHTGLISDISREALEFCTYWCKHLGELNAAMKSIRKLQNDCEWQHSYTITPSLFSQLHSGVIFEKRRRDDNTYTYTVYLAKLRRVARLRTIVDFPVYSNHLFKLFFFADEDNIQTRIRIEVVPES
jgi:exoribonuclease R